MKKKVHTMPAQNQVDSVKVRMYRHGFGDCFLLSFFTAEERVFTVLIDCGIKYNTKSDDVPIEKVMEDLRETLTPIGKDRPHVDVLVATHEHWDHVAFFHPTRGVDFSDFVIGQVWLAWTEDPDDDEAVEINSRLRDGAAALQLAARKLHLSNEETANQTRDNYLGSKTQSARKEFSRLMDDVLGFYGVTALKEVSESGIEYRPDGKISTMTEQAVKNIVKLGKNSAIRYFSPGTCVDAKLLPPGLNVYVLGPPRSSKINKSNPSSGQEHETYFSIDNHGMSSFVDGLLGMGASEAGHTASDEGAPFGSDVGITADDAAQDPYFSKTYFDKQEKHRRIDNSWLDISGQFALQLDGAINNTSLVLAFEFASSRKVLLFPGDAQVGSWLSWHDHEWEVKVGRKKKKRTAAELLQNTVLYKVSHHGSHNATIKDQGLELMQHPDLVAMIPEKEESYSGILYQPLMDALLKRCHGRVLVSADKNFPPEALRKKRPPQLSTKEWAEFKKQLTVDPVYVEYHIDGG